jgi:subfamily B ATP-binding cassette protein MsbA
MTNFKKILEYTKKYWKQLLISGVAASFYGAFSAAPTYIVKHVVDEIFVNRLDHLLSLFILSFLFIFLLKGIFMYLSSYYMHWVGNKIINDIRFDLFKKVIYFPTSFFQKKTTGELMSHFLNDIQMIQVATASAIRNGSRSFFEATFLITVAFIQNWKLALLMLIVGPAVGITISKMGKAIKNASMSIQQSIGKTSSMLQEVFIGIREVKAFNGEKIEINRFSKYLKTCFHSIMRNVHFSSFGQSFIEVISMSGVGIVMYVASHQILKGVSSPGQITSFFAALLLAYQPLKRLINVYSEIQYGLGAAERIFKLMDKLHPAKENKYINLKIIKKELNKSFEIRFENVSFSYDNKEYVLKNINLSIKKSEKIGIIGPSGSGKSTLCDLLLGFITPNTGKIIVNNHDIAKIPMALLRKKIGYVGQKTFLFDDTIYANVSYSQSEKTENHILQACKDAHADEFIQKLKNKYETVVGENGNILSGGQKQRLTIARAMLKNPKLLIFDEATSALDQESEDMIKLALQDSFKNKTVIVISHRLSFIEKMDTILIVKNKTVSKIPKNIIHKQLKESII